MNAWVVRWDWAGDAAKARIDSNKVWVFNGRLSRDQVLLLVEQIYIEQFFTLDERLLYARRGKWYRHMRQYLFHSGTFQGVPYDGDFTFGQHPYLVACWSKNVRVVDAEGGERLAYDCHRPKPFTGGPDTTTESGK